MKCLTLRQLLLSFVVVGWFTSYGVCGVISEIKLSRLDRVNAGYFYSIKNGISQGGISKPFLEWRYISQDFGWVNDLSGQRTGTVLIGGTFYADQFIGYTFPHLAYKFNMSMTDSQKNVFSRIFVSFLGGWDLIENKPDYGIFTGFKILRR